MFIACEIYNNSLNSTFQVYSIAEGIDTIKRMAQKQLCRQLTQQETVWAEEIYEIYDASDPDNVFCWSVGIVETPSP